MLWELLANRRLFLGKNELETVELVQQGEVPALTLLHPDVPEELDRLVQRALHRDPRKRYHSAREMADALTDFLFAGGLKVSNYDLSEFLRAVFEHQEVQAEGVNQERINMLIQDEILSLSVMRYAGQPLPVEGANPIPVDTLSRLGGGRISQDDLKGRAVVGDGVVGRTCTQGTALVEMLEGRETVPMATIGAGTPVRNRTVIWVIAGVVLVAGLAVGGWFLWSLVLAG